MTEATQTTATLAEKAAHTAETVAHTADSTIDAVAPLVDALSPIIGPALAGAAPWLVVGLASALPALLIVWPVLRRIAKMTDNRLDDWLEDRLAQLIEWLVWLLLKKKVQLRESGNLEDHTDLPQTAEEATAGLPEDEVAASMKDAGL